LKGSRVMYREHPLRIIRYCAKNIWLLIFPLIRGIYAGLSEAEMSEWIRGLWLDIAIIGMIITAGLIMWCFSVIEVGEKLFIHKSGVLIRSIKIIPYKNISTLKAEKPFYLRFFGDVKLICETSGGTSGSRGIMLTAGSTLYNEIKRNLPTAKKERSEGKKHSALWAVMLSAFFSSGFSGSLYIAAVFFKGGDIAKDIVSESIKLIADETAKLSDRLILSIPTAAAAAGGFFIAAWIFSFTVNLLRYSGFRIHRSSLNISIECGLLTKRSYNINTAHINYTDLRQSLIMKYLRIVTVNISCAGYGNTKRRLPVVIPMRKIESESKDTSEIKSSTSFRPAITVIWQYVWFPVIFAAGVFVLYLFIRKDEKYAEFALFGLFMVEIPLTWLLIVKVTALFTSGVLICGESIVIKYSKGFRFHNIIVRLSKISEITSIQSPFQKMLGKCTIKFIAESKEKYAHIIKGLRYSDYTEIIGLLKRKNI